MTLTNHVLTGAVLGKFLPLPLALPLALASHFILDALPHFGFANSEEQIKHIRSFKIVIAIDILLTALSSIWLLKSGHATWLLVGLVAYSPDIVWIYRFIVEEKFGKIPPTKGNWFIQFHNNIQKYGRVWGMGIEAAYSLFVLALLRS